MGTEELVILVYSLVKQVGSGWEREKVCACV
jgi:hypothetical protein